MQASTRAAAAVLGIDTATADTAVALTRGGELLCERRGGAEDGGRPRHAALLMAEVEAAVGAAGGWEGIGLIAVGVGPGTFTGLRIGVATARALAQARAIGLAAVSSLEALARGIAADPPSPRLALIDARRGELFAAMHGPAGEPIWEPFVATPDAIGARLRELGASAVAAGDGSVRFRSELEAAGVQVLPAADPAHRIDARHVCALGDRAGAGPLEQVKPIYLRRPDAELWRER